MSEKENIILAPRFQRCSNCNFGVEGNCRRYPPKIVFASGEVRKSNFEGVWPTVKSNDWCGEWLSEQTPK